MKDEIGGKKVTKFTTVTTKTFVVKTQNDKYENKILRIKNENKIWIKYEILSYEYINSWNKFNEKSFHSFQWKNKSSEFKKPKGVKKSAIKALTIDEFEKWVNDNNSTLLSRKLPCTLVTTRKFKITTKWRNWKSKRIVEIIF